MTTVHLWYDNPTSKQSVPSINLLRLKRHKLKINQNQKEMRVVIFFLVLFLLTVTQVTLAKTSTINLIEYVILMI